MENNGCLYCIEKKSTYSWSGADINVLKNIFFGSYIQIVELLEDPWRRERYPKEEVFQCEKCNAVWHIDYYFPDRPPLHVNAKVISEEEFETFFIEIGVKLSKKYKNMS